MPGFHADPTVLRLIDSISYTTSGEASPAQDLPEGAPAGTPRRERSIESHYTIWVQPRLPGDGEWSHWMSRHGEYELAMRLHPDPVGPAARRGELRLADGTRFYRLPVSDGTLLASVAPVGAEGYLLIEAKGSSLDGPGFDSILGTMTLRVAGEAPADPVGPDGPVTVLDGMARITRPDGFTLLTEPDAVTLMAEDGRGFLTLARGPAVMPPHGILARMPEGRLGSWGGGAHHEEWTEYGWPGTLPEFVDGGGLVTGWHFLRIARECLPGGVPVAFAWGGVTQFTGGDSLDRARNAFDIVWPGGMTPCTPDEIVAAALAARGGAFPETMPEAAPAPQPEAEPVAAPMPVPATDPVVTPAPILAPPPPPPPPENAGPDLFQDIGGGYACYRNARFGTEITCPASYFQPEPPPGNGDGRRFDSADAAARFLVFAEFNVLGQSLGDLMQADEGTLGRERITYRASGTGWYVLSGPADGRIFYRKVMLTPDDLIRVFEIIYPEQLKAEFDPVIGYMARNFGPEDQVFSRRALHRSASRALDCGRCSCNRGMPK